MGDSEESSQVAGDLVNLCGAGAPAREYPIAQESSCAYLFQLINGLRRGLRSPAALWTESLNLSLAKRRLG